ncbi:MULTISPECIES: hypothetical protein [unclassified Enterococcus]|uniref:hypothetical protein n=1 Tax=unclassified Enterococcus TaxID=2608891 RepID=UPI001556A76C|nr:MULTISPECIES: hypothetical protein [unclassified Enterococcus]MBS7576315.1 hypothetical protein [Enterococcus sp. MMGLQ5-2]MBS7583548.1 hypothetical protein [Enterococcus sp. MMGLQ5-1]NPD11410.1 hypothetical protein [Enterococcus sp. MMGLQ5-1]NPD36153.1 hypothetical protein [Enterococcus sp. MMGLQ5-2]
MVEKKYDRYVIEKLNRINTRYFFAKIHERSYIIDYFNILDFRNYFPFRMFSSNRKKSWKIYDVTGKELIYKTTSLNQISFSYWFIVSMPLMNLIFSFLTSEHHYFVLFLLLFSYITMLITLFNIFNKQKYSFNKFKTLKLEIIKNKISRTFEEKLETLWQTLIKILWFVVFLFLIYLSLQGLANFFNALFYISLFSAIGNVYGNRSLDQMSQKNIKF